MFQINKDNDLNEVTLSSILSTFQTSELPTLRKLKNYYDGKQEILMKVPTDIGKPCNKVVVNYCYSIVQNFLGYLTGIPIKYRNDEFNDIIEILNYNDVVNEDALLLRNALIFGKSFELCYLDEEGKQRFKVLDSRECIPVYDDTLNEELLYVIRFWKIPAIELTKQDQYYVEVYGNDTTRKYLSTNGFSGLKLIEELPNYYGMCPVSIFKLNNDEKSIFDQVISLQDSYNNLLSAEIDDFSSFADAYLQLKGVIADADELRQMKENRCLMIPADAEASYLTKSISDTQIENMLKNINEKIHKISNSPDFNDEKFFGESGIALRYKLIGFENSSADIESYFRKCLQRRIELLSKILSLTDTESIWRDVQIIFTRNLPQMLVPNSVQELIMLKGLVSDETLLGLLPFIENPLEELQKVKQQEELSLQLYSFGVNNEDDNLLVEQN